MLHQTRAVLHQYVRVGRHEFESQQGVSLRGSVRGTCWGARCLLASLCREQLPRLPGDSDACLSIATPSGSLTPGTHLPRPPVKLPQLRVCRLRFYVPRCCITSACGASIVPIQYTVTSSYRIRLDTSQSCSPLAQQITWCGPTRVL
jgi:hypothetical protein